MDIRSDKRKELAELNVADAQVLPKDEYEALASFPEPQAEEVRHHRSGKRIV